MTGEEIRVLAEMHTEDLPIEAAQALKFINECIVMDLGKDAGVVRQQTVSVTADEWVDLTETFLVVFEIEKSGSNTPYYGRKYKVFHDGNFDIREKKIRFAEPGTYKIWGYVVPPLYEDETLESEPEVHELLHYPIAIYVASRATFWDDEENPAALLKMNEYFLHRSKVLRQLNETRPTTERARIMRINAF